MPEVTLKMTPDALNMIVQALSDSVNFRQQQMAILINSLQAQAASQVQPVAVTGPSA